VRINRLKPLFQPLRRVPVLGDALVSLRNRLASRKAKPAPPAPELCRAEARRRADDCGYCYAEACATCDLRAICDGIHGDYATIFGTGEAAAVQLGGAVEDPIRFICEQEKVVEPEDEAWAR
jgi:hypothetical protein